MIADRRLGRTHVVDFFPPLNSLGKLAFIALLLGLGVEILRSCLGELLSDSSPALSVVVDPTQARARVAVSERLLVPGRAAVRKRRPLSTLRLHSSDRFVGRPTTAPKCPRMASTPSLLSPQMRAGLFDLPTDHDEVSDVTRSRRRTSPSRGSTVDSTTGSVSRCSSRSSMTSGDSASSTSSYRSRSSTSSPSSSGSSQGSSISTPAATRRDGSTRARSFSTSNCARSGKRAQSGSSRQDCPPDAASAPQSCPPARSSA